MFTSHPSLASTRRGSPTRRSSGTVIEILGFAQATAARLLCEAWPSREPLAPPDLPRTAELERDIEASRRVADILVTWRASMPEPHATLCDGVIVVWYGEP